MKFKIIRSLSIKSIIANKELSIPFVLSSSFISALFYVMYSLRGNEFVRTRHNSLITMISIGIFIIFLLVLIFIIYADRFIQKRREKELALYQILGLEKKHLKMVLLLETVIYFLVVCILSIISGYLFGKIFFMLLNKLVDTGVKSSFAYYFFDFSAARATIILISIAIGFSYIKNIIIIRKLNPIEFFRSQKQGEKEPKGNLFLAIIGLLTMGGGYFIALTSKSTLGALQYILLAVLLVLIGTYCVFISISIVVLKLLKRNKNKYYRTHRFIFLSQMLYRMKSNAVSIASISILCTGILLTITSTVYIYQGINKVVNNSLVMDYKFEAKDKNSLKEVSDKITKSKVKTSSVVFTKELFSAVSLYKDTLKPLSNKEQNVDRALFLSAKTVTDHNTLFDEDLIPKADTVYISTNIEDYTYPLELKIADKLYNVEVLKKEKVYISSRLGAEVLYLVMPNEVSLTKLGEFYKTYNFETRKYEPSLLRYDLDVSAVEDNTEVYNKMKNISQDSSVNLISRIKVKQFIYELDGGFLFIGILISLVLLSGTVLMLYFKQISEGYEDSNKYKIMIKIGLDDDMTRNTIKQQIVWIFFLPLIFSFIHSLVASRLIVNLLGLFGIRDTFMFYMNFTIVAVIFSLAYLSIYRLTSKTYYRLIK